MYQIVSSDGELKTRVCSYSLMAKHGEANRNERFLPSEWTTAAVEIKRKTELTNFNELRFSGNGGRGPKNDLITV